MTDQVLAHGEPLTGQEVGYALASPTLAQVIRSCWLLVPNIITIIIMTSLSSAHMPVPPQHLLRWSNHIISSALRHNCQRLIIMMMMMVITLTWIGNPCLPYTCSGDQIFTNDSSSLPSSLWKSSWKSSQKSSWKSSRKSPWNSSWKSPWQSSWKSYRA